MAKKFYAVRKGRTTGIFTDWSQCEAAVSRYPGAEYKSFASVEDAAEYMTETQKDVEQYDTQSISIYTDGSYCPERKAYGWGCAIPGHDSLQGSGKDERYLPARNVAGEVFAALNAIDWATKNGFAGVRLCHDYEGIRKWATGEWKANSPIATMYVDKVRQAKIKVSFQKVQAHAGIIGNEVADRLARAAIGIN